MRRLFKYLLYLMAVLIFSVIALHPWLLKWGINYYARSYGIFYTGFFVEGYKSMQWKGLKIDQPAYHFATERLKIALPLSWLANKLHHQKADPIVLMENWELSLPEAYQPLEVKEKREGRLAKPTYSFEQALEIALALGKWVPTAEAYHGGVTINENHIYLSNLHWESGNLTAKGHWKEFEQTFTIKGWAHSALREFGIKGHFGGEKLDFQLSAKRPEEELLITGRGRYADNPFSLEISFEEESIMPKRAAFRFLDFKLKGHDLYYPPLELLQGSASATWEGGKWKLNLDGKGFLHSPDLFFEKAISSFNLQVVAEGEKHLVRLDKLKVKSPSLFLQLSQPVVFDLSQQWIQEPMQIKIQANLDALSTAGIEGQLSASLSAFSREGVEGRPRLIFSGEGQHLPETEDQIRQFKWNGQLDWPMLVIDNFETVFSNGSELSIQTMLNCSTKIIERGRCAFNLKKKDLETLAPSHFEWDAVTGELVVSGHWPKLKHEGHVKIDPITLPSFPPVVAFLSWKGQSLEDINTHASLRNEVGHLDLTTQIHIDNNSERIELNDLHLESTYQASEKLTLFLTLDAKEGEENLLVERFELAANGETVCMGRGEIPLRVKWKEGPDWVLEGDKPIDFNLSAGPHPSFWEHLASAQWLFVRNPHLTLSLQGNFSAPHGHLSLGAETLQVGPPFWENPLTLNNIDITAELSPDKIKTGRFSFQVWNHPVHFMFEQPMRSKQWVQLFQNRILPDWERGVYHLALEDLPVEKLAAYFPQIVARHGTITLDLSFDPTTRFSGQMKVKGASTRPLPIGSSLREINAAIEIQNEMMYIKNLEGLLQNQPLTITGKIKLENFEAPDFSLRIVGNRLPLIRQDELLLHADIDLTVHQTPGASALVSGNIRLKDGLLLQDLFNLTRKGVNSMPSHPPYFSLSQDPFADWQLDIKVNGDRFIKIDTPLFQGKASAKFSLSGNLREPIAVGQLRLDEGTLLFPFGRVILQQGLILLTPDDPHNPKLELTGTAKSLGYAINMTVTGSERDPIIQLSSNPPLDPDAILLLLTAGVVPQRESQQRGGSVALFFGKNLLRDYFGIEGSEKLKIQMGEDISEEGRETYSVEYELQKNLSITGEYDAFDDYNLNFKWKVLSQ